MKARQLLREILRPIFEAPLKDNYGSGYPFKNVDPARQWINMTNGEYLQLLFIDPVCFSSILSQIYE